VTARLPTRMVAKPWGAEALPPPFAAPAGERIGEVWFEPPAELPGLLVKYIFTSEALSVQVHPSDAQRPGQGKEECWLVIAAEPAARLGIGFARDVSREEMRAAALDGTIEGLLAWHPVRPGDFFRIAAGTVHAIGAGVSLIEVQQNSDTTYRLYDYGRPRELHLEQAVAVASGAPFDPASRAFLPPAGNVTLADGAPFRVDRIEGAPDAALAARYPGPLLVIPRLGTVHVAGEAVRPGECALAPSLGEIEMGPIAQALIAAPA
jgi:mannose-6-phosphate isomerase